MPKPFTDLQLKFAWLKAELTTASTGKQVREILKKGKGLVRSASTKTKKAAKKEQKSLGQAAKERLTAFSSL